jgi:hypothetical protein
MLLIMGVLFVLAGGGLVGLAKGPGKSTTTTTATTTTTDKKTQSETTVTATPGNQARGSDTLDVFLLGWGVVLVLSGAFYERITKIVFPGGAEIELTPAASAKLAEHVKKQVVDSEDPHAFELAYRKALEVLAARYWGKTASPPDEELRLAAVAATARFPGKEEP